MQQLGEKLNRVVNYHLYVPSAKMNFPGIEAFLRGACILRGICILRCTRGRAQARQQSQQR